MDEISTRNESKIGSLDPKKRCFVFPYLFVDLLLDTLINKITFGKSSGPVWMLPLWARPRH